MIASPDYPESPRRSLSSYAGLPEVDAVMLRLALGERLDIAGEMVAECLRGGGKRLRAHLALAAGHAIGVEDETLVPWAAACELLHNATLIHDDIQDADPVRRGLPTVWARYGAGQAINAGDLMLMLPFLAVGEIEAPPAIRSRLYAAIAVAAARTARGQAAEMELPNQDEVGWPQWICVAEGKSGALLGLPVQGAAILAGLDDCSSQALAGAFSRAGVLYQLQDDLLDLSAAKGKGRSGSDLREGKMSALIVAHLELHPSEAVETYRWLRDPVLRADDAFIATVEKRLFEGGAVERVQEQLPLWADSVTRDARLRAIPELAAVAEELVERVQRAGAASISMFRGSAA